MFLPLCLCHRVCAFLLLLRLFLFFLFAAFFLKRLFAMLRVVGVALCCLSKFLELCKELYGTFFWHLWLLNFWHVVQPTHLRASNILPQTSFTRRPQGINGPQIFFGDFFLIFVNDFTIILTYLALTSFQIGRFFSKCETESSLQRVTSKCVCFHYESAIYATGH